MDTFVRSAGACWIRPGCWGGLAHPDSSQQARWPVLLRWWVELTTEMSTKTHAGARRTAESHRYD